MHAKTSQSVLTPCCRQTVIVDTGSHYTAFPCSDCAKCGEEYHTNLLFDYTKSQTFHKYSCNECERSTCRNNRCEFSQSYTEGSSWHAFQSRDKFWIGRDTNDEVNMQLKVRRSETWFSYINEQR